MILPDKGDKGNSDIRRAHILAGLGVPIFCCRMDKDGNPFPQKEWEQTEAGEASHAAIDKWKPGMALCAVGGTVFDFIDVDPRNGGSLPELADALEEDPPIIFGIVSTPSHGAHFYVRTHGLPKGKLLPGVDFQAGDEGGQGRGFVFLPPTVRPSKHESDEGSLRPYKWYMPVSPEVTPWAVAQSESLTDLAINGRAPVVPSGAGRRPVHELEAECLAASAGFQRTCLMAWIQELQYQGESYRAIADRFISLVTRPDWKNFKPSNPYYPSRKGHAEFWIKNLYGKAGRVIPDATAEELEGIRDMIPHREDPDEEGFWNSRPSLAHIRDFARARRAAPWATLGECLVEAICHTPPSLRLPSTVGGKGTLNMLVAIVGKSGAGKNAAANVAEEAFEWKGIMGIIDDEIIRMPIGSGEGIAKCYGASIKDKDTGRYETKRVADSVIFTIPEIDTFDAIKARSGSTLSPEIRKLYSGETLGFGYSDATKRVIIKKGSYRGCVVAGVQPGRGAVILDDIEGGFAQRWLWLPATDAGAPVERPDEPGPMGWMPPERIEDDALAGKVSEMAVFSGAREAIDRARVDTLHDNSGDIETHDLYTRIKVAAGLALLDGSDEVRESDWLMSGYVMKVSERTRNKIRRHLSQKAADANKAAGQAEGVRRVEAESTVEKIARTGIAKILLSKLAFEWTSLRDIKNSTSGRARTDAEGILDQLAEIGRIERQEITNRNGTIGKRYRKNPKQ